MNTGPQWAGNTFGNGWMHHALVKMLRHIDLRIMYAFVAVFIVPGCVFTSSGYRLTYRYMRRRQGFGILKSLWKAYINNCLFGQVVIDKFAMYAGKKFEVEIEGYEHFLQLSNQPEGFIQLSAHIGNYEIAGYSLVAKTKRFNAIVYFGEKASVMDGRNKMFAHTNISMISIRPDMGHLFEIDNALSKGEIVSMPADRLFGSIKSIKTTLLGAEAKLPLGPFSVATMRGLKVLAVNVMKTGSKRYKIYVTPLEYDASAPRKEQIKTLSDAYVTELERLLKQYPTQWYNYFEFWKYDD